MKKVIVAHEDSLIRVGLETIFIDVAPKSVFFYATTSNEILEILEAQKIDVIIFSSEITLDKSKENLLLKKTRDLQIKIFVNFHSQDCLMLLKWMHFGGHGFISNKDPHFELKETFKLALKNDHLQFSKSISETWHYIDSLACLDRIKINTLNNLTPKEMEVLILICEEYTNEEIAIIQSVSVNTIDTHRRNLFIKTGARKTAGLCFYAMKNQLLQIKVWSSKNLIIANLIWNKVAESITEMHVIVC